MRRARSAVGNIIFVGKKNPPRHNVRVRPNKKITLLLKEIGMEERILKAANPNYVTLAEKYAPNGKNWKTRNAKTKKNALPGKNTVRRFRS